MKLEPLPEPEHSPSAGFLAYVRPELPSAGDTVALDAQIRGLGGRVVWGHRGPWIELPEHVAPVVEDYRTDWPRPTRRHRMHDR